MKKRSPSATRGHHGGGIKRRDFLRRALCATGLAVAGGSIEGCLNGPEDTSGESGEDEDWKADSAVAGKRPNIVFIVTDDQAFDAIGYMGRYPFLDGRRSDGLVNMGALRRAGAVFSNAFVTQSLCSPSRATMLTGMYAHTHGVIDNERNDPDWQKHPNIGMLLRQNGYATAFLGKLHGAILAGEKGVRPGFDYWLGFKGQGHYFNPELNENGKESVVKGYITDILTDKALAWLKSGRDKTKPFLMCLWHKAAHQEFSPAPRHEHLWEGEKLPPPPHDTHLDTFEGKPKWHKDRASSYYKPDNKEWMNMLRTLKGVDESIGSVVQELKAQGLYENTVIVYTSDNGYLMSDHRMRDKRIAYESSMRIPLIISWPSEIKAGTQISQMALNIDLAPTLLAMAGAPVPGHMQGRSLLPLLRGKAPADWRTSFLFEYFQDWQYPKAGPNLVVARNQRYKYVENDTPDDVNELYDLQKDPGEMKNRIADPQYGEVLKQMKQELARLKQRTGYPAG